MMPMPTFADQASTDLFKILKLHTCKAPKLLHSENHLPPWAIGEMYFDRNIFDIGENEVYVDCGANQGHTILEFMKLVEGKFNRIYAYEPQRILYDELTDKHSCDDRIVCSDKVCGECVGKAAIRKHYTFPDMTDTAFVEKKSGTHVMTTLDNDLFGFDDIPTIIKMDIEGMEREALVGASCLLEINKPKLAIACYHRRDDIEEIPKLLKKYNQSYSLHLRHYWKENPHSTILYAV